MSRIDINNYEAYLLDFYEGNLNEELRAELDLFLIEHPELDAELTELPYLTVEDAGLTFSEKNNLKKTASSLVSEHNFISYIEHQLSPPEARELEKNCALNESLAKELTYYTQTISQADLSVVFPDKEGLKRTSKIIWLPFSTGTFAAAASVALVFGLFVLWPQSKLPHTLAAKHVIKHVPVPSSDKQSLQNGLSSSHIKTEPSVSTLSKATEGSLPNHLPEKNIASQSDPAHREMLPSIKADTAGALASGEPVKKEFTGKEEELTSSENKTVVETITESEDDLAVNSSKSKKGLWTLAAKALNNLNKVGVKKVNGDEEQSPKEQTSYALTVGSLNISHKGN